MNNAIITICEYLEDQIGYFEWNFIFSKIIFQIGNDRIHIVEQGDSRIYASVLLSHLYRLMEELEHIKLFQINSSSLWKATLKTGEGEEEIKEFGAFKEEALFRLIAVYIINQKSNETTN